MEKYIIDTDMENEFGEIHLSTKGCKKHMNLSEEEFKALVTIGIESKKVKLREKNSKKYLCVIGLSMDEKEVENAEVLQKLIKIIKYNAVNETVEGYLYLDQQECLKLLNVSWEEFKIVMALGVKRESLKYEMIKNIKVICYSRERRLKADQLDL